MTIEKECEELKKENRKLKKQLAILEDLKLENEQLKKEVEKYTQKEECAYVLKNNIGDVIFYCDKDNSIVACYKTFEEANKSVVELAKINPIFNGCIIDFVPLRDLKKWEYDNRYENSKKMTKLDYIELISSKRNVKPKTSKFHYLFTLSIGELEQIYLYNLPILNGKGKWQQKHKENKFSEKEVSVFVRFKQNLINTKQASEELNMDSKYWYQKYKLWEREKNGK